MVSRPDEHRFRSFLRYRPVIDDWAAFCAAGGAPLPACIWTNTLKTTPERLIRRLPLEPIDWYEGAFRCPKGVQPAQHLPYLAGHYLIQEEAAMLPVVLLDPQPGESILDLCAAPGNKTAQIAVRMRSEGLVVANDRSKGRLGILRRVIGRLGLTSAAVMCHDAAGLPGEPDTFDRVLADVPCSGEGTLRRSTHPVFTISPGRRAYLQRIQMAILTRAVHFCRPGGRIVYATCTFAPEENEAVVDGVLRRYDGQLTVEPAHTPGLHLSPGLTEWGGEQFLPELAHTARLWPHHNDTGGFYVAVLRKAGTGLHAPRPARPARCDAPEVVEHFVRRYGIPEGVFTSYDVINHHAIRYLVARSAWPAGLPAPAQHGLPLQRTPQKIPKLKTGAAMLLGRYATRNRLTLTLPQARAYVERKPFFIDADALPPDVTPGYVLLAFDEIDIGLGFLSKKNERFEVLSLLPDKWHHGPVYCQGPEAIKPSLS